MRGVQGLQHEALPQQGFQGSIGVFQLVRPGAQFGGRAQRLRAELPVAGSGGGQGLVRGLTFLPPRWVQRTTSS